VLQRTTIMQRLGLAKGRHPVVRLAFEEQQDALDWCGQGRQGQGWESGAQLAMGLAPFMSGTGEGLHERSV
jgi:hypothetical protein